MKYAIYAQAVAPPNAHNHTCSFSVAMEETGKFCLSVRYSVCVEFLTLFLTLLPPGVLSVLVSLLDLLIWILLICDDICSFTRSYIHFPRLLVELFSPHLLTHGVVEPFSAKSIVGSSKLWPCLAFLHIVQVAAGSVLDSVPR